MHPLASGDRDNAQLLLQLLGPLLYSPCFSPVLVFHSCGTPAFHSVCPCNNGNPAWDAGARVDKFMIRVVNNFTFSYNTGKSVCRVLHVPSEVSWKGWRFTTFSFWSTVVHTHPLDFQISKLIVEYIPYCILCSGWDLRVDEWLIGEVAVCLAEAGAPKTTFHPCQPYFSRHGWMGSSELQLVSAAQLPLSLGLALYLWSSSTAASASETLREVWAERDLNQRQEKPLSRDSWLVRGFSRQGSVGAQTCPQSPRGHGAVPSQLCPAQKSCWGQGKLNCV